MGDSTRRSLNKITVINDCSIPRIGYDSLHNIPTTTRPIIKSYIQQYPVPSMLYNTIAPSTPMAIAPAPTYDAAAAFVVAAAGLADADRDALIDMLPFMPAVADATAAGMLVIVTPASAQSDRTADVTSICCISQCPSSSGCCPY
jgi:hypothetical protein